MSNGSVQGLQFQVNDLATPLVREGISSINEQLARRPEQPLVPFIRTSGRICKGRKTVTIRKVKDHYDKLVQVIRTNYPNAIILDDKQFYGIEPGQLDADRPQFEAALSNCRREGAALATSVYSRLCRADGFSLEENPIEPGPVLNKRLVHEIAIGVQLVTYYPPGLSISEEHGLETQLCRQRQKRKLEDPNLLMVIMWRLIEGGGWYQSRKGVCWPAISDVAKKYGIARNTISAAATWMSPYGMTWLDLAERLHHPDGLRALEKRGEQPTFYHSTSRTGNPIIRQRYQQEWDDDKCHYRTKKDANVEPGYIDGELDLDSLPDVVRACRMEAGPEEIDADLKRQAARQRDLRRAIAEEPERAAAYEKLCGVMKGWYGDHMTERDIYELLTPRQRWLFPLEEWESFCRDAGVSDYREPLSHRVA